MSLAPWVEVHMRTRWLARVVVAGLGAWALMVVAVVSAQQSSVDRGLALLNQGKYAEAIEVLTQAIEEDPTNVRAWNARGMVRRRLKDLDGAWNDLTGTSVQLVEDASASAQARTDWEQDDLHLIWFDENDSSGYFPSGSSTVAITPVWFFSNGLIADADVIFNGRGFQFTTSSQTGRFDVQDVGTHELGHLLGLDHSGWAGASMYPYVDSRILLHRSLSLDELRGMRDAYPSGSHARITGTVKRASDSSVVAGAQVVAVDANGRTSAGALSETDGTFELYGLEGGTYQVYAAPLDEPLDRIVAVIVAAVRVRHFDVTRTRNHRSERPLDRGHTVDRQRTHRGAVIGAAPRNRLVATVEPPVRLVLFGELERRLYRFGSARRKEHARISAERGKFTQSIREHRRRHAGKRKAIDERNLLQLGDHRVDDFLPAVAGIDRVQAGQAIEEFVPLVIPDGRSFTTNDDGRARVGVFELGHLGKVNPEIFPNGIVNAGLFVPGGGRDRCCHGTSALSRSKPDFVRTMSVGQKNIVSATWTR